MPHFRTLTEISYELAQRIPPEYQRGPIFYLAQTEKEARQLQQLCQYWNAQFPTETIISPQFLDDHTVSEESYAAHTIDLHKGKRWPISRATARLTEHGLEREPRAVTAGQYAIRGNIIDIYDKQPVRIELDDDDMIERLHLYNPSTQEYLPGNTAAITRLLLWPRAYSKHLPLWQDADLKYSYITPKYYHKRTKLLQEDMQEYLDIFVVTKDEYALEKILPNAKPLPFNKSVEAFAQPDKHMIVLTDVHIFGHEASLDEYESELDTDELTPGDYVVHIDHGIALFDGFRDIDGQQYLVLLYAKNDKLFVPAHQVKRVELYVGEETPKLTRLSTADWEQVIQTVKEDVQQTAEELLRMHAERKMASATAFPAEKTAEEISIDADVDFALTPDQAAAVHDILHDLNSTTAMNRLLCGDVGFGKTEVALRAAAHVALNGYQVALLAPTTVLAQQHTETMQERLQQYGIRVEGLSRLQSTQEQKAIVAQAREGNVDILIGTHRLLSKDVDLPKLALVIIDEEQRFGVKHKERFKAMRTSSHVLTMTATPIPRTLNLALSGVEDISVLNTAPQQRKPISTIINAYDEAIVQSALEQEFERSGQVYYVHNNLQTIYYLERMWKKRFPDKRFAIAHGKMSATSLMNVMHEFHAGTIDCLLASTIVENGLDISNANTLVIDHAERFGLAQLYQLRGRVGRGNKEAYAYMLYQEDSLTPQAQKRLKALHAVKELGGGFELAMKDLEIRGVGDILGKKQHGRVQQVGLHLYTRLLQQAIEELENK